MNYYNEFDPKAAAWLRELIREGHIPLGRVDERSIVDVQPDELRDYNQCHFFAGIGGWSYALRLAAWPEDRPVWTGSCPCQPFSSAGLGRGEADERHLWPAWFQLIRQCRPGAILGEQVASKAALGWFDGVSADLEAAGYAAAAFDLCSPGVNSPHIRQRLHWVAYAERDAGGTRRTAEQSREGVAAEAAGAPVELGRCSMLGWLEQPSIDGRLERGAEPSRGSFEPRRLAGGLGNPDGSGPLARGQAAEADGHGRSAESDGDVSRLADPGRQCDERRGAVGDLPGTAGSLESEARERQWSGDAVADRRSTGGLAHHHHERLEVSPADKLCADASAPAIARRPWSDFDILPCTDGKSRRVESGTFPLAHGVPGRVGLLRGYGNAINPYLAAEFIEAVQEVIL